MATPKPGVRVGFLLELPSTALTNYVMLKPAEEFATRDRYFKCLLGAKNAEFQQRFADKFADQPTGSTRGHIGGMNAFTIATAAVAIYNTLGTGTTFVAPAEPPHCVRYEVYDGQIVVIYNWDLAVATCVEGPPPGAEFHVAVYVDDPGL